MKKSISYSGKGLVLGSLWGGGQGWYETIRLNANTKKDLIKAVEKALNDKSLDSGMGFESLIGAILSVEKLTSINLDGHLFCNKEYEVCCVGEITEQNEDMIDHVFLNYI